MRRPEEHETSGGAGIVITDTAFIKRCPVLFAYLTDTRWDDGSARETSTLTVMADDGVIKICINDRALHRSQWVSGPTLQGALDAAEGVLSEGRGGWRVWKEDQPRRKVRN